MAPRSDDVPFKTLIDLPRAVWNEKQSSLAPSLWERSRTDGLLPLILRDEIFLSFDGTEV